MKKIILKFLTLCLSGSLYAQWTPVPIVASSSAVTSMFAYADTILAGTDGDGIFKTLNLGTSWIDISGNIGNSSINDIRGGVGPKVVWAATDDGAYLTQDHINYLNCTSTGLSTADITYFWFGDGSETAEWAIGTNGEGVFVSDEISGPWNYSSNGLTGAGLVINDLAGYSDDEVDFAVVATNNGVYFSFDSLMSWASNNNGLSGDQLIVKRLGCLGSAVIIATHGGCYYTADFGDSWIPLLPGEKFNSMLLYPTLTGINFFVFGEAGYYTTNFTDFYAIDLSGISGEVISLAATSTYLFIGTSETGKVGKSGSIYKKPLEQIITEVPNNSILKKNESNMKQNYPNPFNTSTEIMYSLTSEGFVLLKVYDFLGREVCILVNEFQNPGQYSVRFEPENLSGGIYNYILHVNGLAFESKKMVLKK